MERPSFVFYKDWMEAIRDLPDEIRLEIYESIIMYATLGKLPVLKPMANIAFNFIHLLARIELKVIAADDISATNYGNLTSALVTVPNQLELSVSADGNTILSKKTSSTNLILDFGTLSLDTMDTTTSSGYMVYPDASDIATINLAFTNRPAQDYAIENLTLEAGKISVIVATVSASEINFAITLKQWQAGNGTGQDIDI